MTPARFSAAAFVATLVAFGASCGQSNEGSRSDAAPPNDSPVYVASAPMGTCGAVVQQQAIEGRVHIPVCSAVEYGTKPPSSGNHYPVWAAYGVYTAPVPEGYWVHNLEHGTIVISYNCTGCENDIAAAATMLSGLPNDPECVSLGEGVFRRSLMTPDPYLDVPFAASAWGWTLRASCFDADAFQAFALAHYNQGPEDLCEQGVDPTCGDE